MRSRSDRVRDVKLSWAHTVTIKHTDINFRVIDSVASAGFVLIYRVTCCQTCNPGPVVIIF